MLIPVTINANTLKTYSSVGRKDGKNVLQSDNLTDWDRDIPKSLQEICLEAIAQNWEENPVLDEVVQTVDRCLLLNILPTELPLHLTVPKISDDIYWKRCYVQRWPKLIPKNVALDFQISEIVKVNSHNGSNQSNSSSRRPSKGSNESNSKSRSSSSCQQQDDANGRKWKECFLEMHIREYLENLKPEDYDAEKIKELTDLCGTYVKILDIRELQCSENSSSRIPLTAILSGFGNLKELSICFKQTYVGEKFTWDILRVSLQDVKNLARGLEKCHLRVFRLVNSDIDDEKATIILKSLLKHEQLQTLDFSHCRISYRGSVALSKFCLQNPVTDLILANNKIGPKGIGALCYAMSNNCCNLRFLDLKLNPVMEEGGEFLMRLLMMGARSIKKLSLNGCRLGRKNTSIGAMIEHNTSLEQLDLSNNALGEEMGRIILQGLRYNTTLKKLDVRMCKLSSVDEFEILEKINKNRKALRASRTRRPVIVEPQFDFQISDELRFAIEEVFDERDDTVALGNLNDNM